MTAFSVLSALWCYGICCMELGHTSDMHDIFAIILLAIKQCFQYCCYFKVFFFNYYSYKGQFTPANKLEVGFRILWKIKPLVCNERTSERFQFLPMKVGLHCVIDSRPERALRASKGWPVLDFMQIEKTGMATNRSEVQVLTSVLSVKKICRLYRSLCRI